MASLSNVLFPNLIKICALTVIRLNAVVRDIAEDLHE